MEILQLIVTSLGPTALTLFLLFVFLINRRGFGSASVAQRRETIKPVYERYNDNALPNAAE